ncbi:branched-chain amino acid ABC transporter permease [Longispora albida]|uniref:branched-chain amino acid ABC transporter permease n=1 Tax=Longispora albida TaxID=203523 RepID=UPI000371AB90|nr:branched-chain amino acid ABC transporter permease [Longispora albida]
MTGLTSLLARPGAKRLLGYALFVTALLLVPAVFTRLPFYTMAVANLVILGALAGLGLVPLTGRAGQISMGQAAFYGIGAYTSALLSLKFHVPVLVAVVAGVAAGAGVAWLVGLFIFRTQGHYLALATLAFGLAIGFLVNQLEFTGANGGLTGLKPLFGITDHLQMFYILAGVLFVAVVLVDSVLRSDVGRVLTALGDSPIGTASSGISISALRRSAFSLAGGLAALAGALHAHWQVAVNPGMFSILDSVMLLVMATVGGLRTVWGPPLGALCVLTLSEMSKLYIPEILPNAHGKFEIAVYGLCLVLVVLFLPSGLAGGAGSLWRRLRGARA